MTDPVRVKVTNMGKLGWGVRIFVTHPATGEEKLWMEGLPRIAKTREEIGPLIQSDLRMINKCGIESPMAEASRHRWKVRR